MTFVEEFVTQPERRKAVCSRRLFFRGLLGLLAAGIVLLSGCSVGVGGV